MKAFLLVLCLAAGIVGTFIVADDGIVPYPSRTSAWRPSQTRAITSACAAGAYDQSVGGTPTSGWLTQSGGEGLRCAGTGVGNVAGATGRLLWTLVAAFRLVDILVGVIVGLLLYFIVSRIARFVYSRAVYPPVRHIAPAAARHLPAPDFRPRPRGGPACYRR